MFLGFTQVRSQTAIPETSAGRTFTAWLDTFSSADRAVEEQHLKIYDPSKSLDDEMRFRSMTGGFVLTQVLKSEPQRLDPTDNFAIGVPFARAINPVTHNNWEGTGVEPDVKVPAADALNAAK